MHVAYILPFEDEDLHFLQEPNVFFTIIHVWLMSYFCTCTKETDFDGTKHDLSMIYLDLMYSV